MAWTSSNGIDQVVQAATRPAGGSWSAPANLSAAGQDASSLGLALDAQGNAVAAWTSSGGTNGIVQAATRPAGGSWSAPADLSAAGQDASNPGLAVGAQGDAVVMWTSNGTNQVVHAATRPAGGSWSAPADLSSSGQDASNPGLAVGPQGSAVVAWTRFDGTNSIVQAVTRPAGGSWSTPPADLSSGNQTASSLGFAVDAQGTAAVIWTASAFQCNPPVVPLGDRCIDDATAFRVKVIQAAIRPAGDGWRATESVSSIVGNADNAQLAFDPRGSAVAVWSRVDGTRAVIEAATRRPGESWSLPENISDDVAPDNSASAIGPNLALDSQGNAVVLWARRGVNDGSIILGSRAAGYDAAGPQLRALNVPASGSPGAPVTFGVDPVDVWSQVVSTSWNFGDGTPVAGGNSVSHSYAAAGNYQVTVTSTDSLGNASTETRSVRIAIAPAVLPGAGGGGAATVSGTGGAQLPPAGGGSAVLPHASEARRMRAFRGCLTRARAHTRSERRGEQRASAAARPRARRHLRGHATAMRRRCVARHGRTPGRVTGLSGRAPSKKVIELSFNAPGTDRNRPPPARGYLIKQSTKPITDLRSFRRAKTLCNGSCRFPVTRVGEQLKLKITDLRSRTTYYYAVAARDNVTRRLGPRSAAVRARTR